MSVISQSKTLNIDFKATPFIVLGVLVFVFFMAILMVFRLHCTTEGYKIYELSRELDKKTLRYEAVSQKYSDALRWEVLYKKAEQMDFTFPVGGNVFYVQQ